MVNEFDAAPKNAPDDTAAVSQQRFADAASQEWLETNGCGAYASTSMADCHTRRYHGLLVAPLPDQQGRTVLLSQLEATALVGEDEYALAVNYYPGAIHPRGDQYVVESSIEPCPTHVYSFAGVQLRREIIMLAGEEAVYLRYSLEGSVAEIKLQLKPLLSFRDSHALSFENMQINAKCKRFDNGIRLTPYPSLPSLYIQYNQPLEFYAGPCWEKNVTYPRETERGFDDHEDRFYPGVFEVLLLKDAPLLIRVGVDNAGYITQHAIVEELQQRMSLANSGRSQQEQLLRRQARHFFSVDLNSDNGRAALNGRATFNERAAQPQIIAGYPWFGSWGRDAMIALPGLCVYNNELERGKLILRHVAGLLKNGLLPNTFAGIQGAEAFNSVDAALWFTWAAQEVCAAVQDGQKDDEFLHAMHAALAAIIRGYRNNETGITQCNEHGLISSGNANTQYTWMDVTAWGKPVTPRYGHAVEINALWYNALRFYFQLSQQLDESVDATLQQLADEFPAHFQEMFWLDDLGFCADVHNQFGHDVAMRPNQLFAVSLPFSPLDETQQRHVVLAVERELFTPYGIRTLSPQHPAYCGHYAGGPDQRDASYHQGTVWPWLIGAFVAARLKVSADPRHRERDLQRKLHRLFNDHVCAYGVGSIAEVFDGDEPHRPGGCFAQAWSVAEIIRAKSLMEIVSEQKSEKASATVIERSQDNE